MLNMCDLFEDDYKEFVLGELTELWDNARQFRTEFSDKGWMKNSINSPLTDPYNIELYGFKVGAFFETQCSR